MKPKIKTMSLNTSSAKSSLVSFENHYNYDATFLLHDIFGYNFDEVAEMLGKSGAACRKLTSRARAGRPRFEANMEDHKRLMESFSQLLALEISMVSRASFLDRFPYTRMVAAKPSPCPNLFQAQMWSPHSSPELQLQRREAVMITRLWLHSAYGLLPPEP